MTKEVKNVPDLRFPGFENTWEKKKLFDILKSKGEGIKRGPFGGALKKEIFKNSGFAIYEQKNAIYDNQHFRYFIDEEKYNEMIGFAVKQGDIIMSCSGTIGKLSLIPEDAKIGIINQALIRFRTNNTILNTYFLIYMRSQYMQKKILESNPGSAITNLIPVKELKLLNFPLPNINEQQKIGEFFSKLDQQIELEEQKLEKLEEQKKGYMQKVFSQELRFKDENGNDYPEWEIKKLLQIAKVKTGSKNVQDNIQDGKYKFFDRSVEVKYLNTFDFDETAIIYPGEGSKFLPRYFSGKYSLHQRAYSIYDININNNYLYYYLSLQNNHFLKYAVGSTVKSLRMSGFDKLKVMVPKNSEQEKIGSFFKNLDEFIEKQANKVALLKQRKQSFLQKMFV